MTKVNKLLAELSATRSKTEKLSLLKDGLKSDTIAREIFKLAHDPFITFGVLPDTDEPAPEPAHDERLTEVWSSVRQVLGEMADGDLTGNAARVEVSAWMKVPGVRAVLWRILMKDLRAGVDTAINKAYPGLIPEFNVALAIDAPEDIEYPAWAEPKYDGVRTIAIIDNNGNASLFSRSGKPYDNFPNIKNALRKLGLHSRMLDGEVMGRTFDDVMNVAHRKPAKGEKDDTNLTYMVFDTLPDNEFLNCACTQTLSRRRAWLKAHIVESDYVKLTPGEVVNSTQEMEKLFRVRRKQGYEGLVVKSEEHYSFDRTTAWIKVKEMLTVEGRIVGLEKGTGKHAERLGAISVDIDGVVTKVGSGFDDATRDRIWRGGVSKYVGKMVEVQAQEKTKDGAYRFPVFLRFREDKE